MAVRKKAKKAARPLARRKALAPRKAGDALLGRQLAEALAQQAATAAILKVIARSPTDVQPVFDAIVKSAAALCDARYAVFWRMSGDGLRPEAWHNVNRKYIAYRRLHPVPVSPKQVMGRVALTRKPVHVLDVLAEPGYVASMAQKLGEYRTVLGVPVLRKGELIGTLAVFRSEVRPFSSRQIALLQTFADQAVIAIENVRLLNETKEALERQTATAEVLKVIAGSPTDVTPVFEAIVRSACTLCGAEIAAMFHYDGKLVHLGATHNWSDEALRYFAGIYPSPPSPALMSGRTILAQSVVTIEDATADEHYDPKSASTGHWRRMLGVPMLREGRALGAIVVCWREPGQTPQRQVDLLQTFADQAVIAIENVRLFNETKEALERQTATAEILRVIASSPSSVQPVFDAIASSAMQLISGFSAAVVRVESDALHLSALTTTSDSGDEALKGIFPLPIGGQNNVSFAVRTRAPRITVDIESDPETSELARTAARARGWRAGIAVPMLRDGQAVGAINVTRREPGPFADHHVKLLQTFADQAVIAIENVRLFNETREALEKQTATAEILRVISSAPTDTQPVFEAIVRNATKLCEGAFANVFRFDGAMVHWAASDGWPPELMPELKKPFPMQPNRSRVAGRVILDGRAVRIEDTRADPGYDKELAGVLQYRRILGVPLLREGKAIGAIVVGWAEPGPIQQRHEDLLQTFADQAVIAIENVRLFKELQARTEALTKSVGQLTALGEVGQAISSTLDLETVLKTIVARAVQLTGLDGGSIYEYDERTEEFRLQAAENMAAELIDEVRRNPIRKGDGAVGHTAVTLEAAQVPDILEDGYKSARKELLIRAGYRAILVVPLLREDHLLGALLVNRGKPGRFPSEVVELLKTFASQSAMAIQNARLFREIAEKGRQLEEASRHKSNFLASMSHELRTPLNAILGFNEMILGQVYGEVPADMQEPLTDIQTSGKHLLRLINNVLDLAKIEAGRMELSLQDYSVHDTVASVHSTLRPLAAEKGLEFLANVPNEVPLAFGDGGRIAQCLMNLAGNSLKFTKAGKVEIVVETNGDLLVYKVTDTGIGIPPDKIASLFTEFKQTDATIASEYGGTGLGLSISRKFVEMHGGRIWVESELGKGSAFIFEVPLRAKTA